MSWPGVNVSVKAASANSFRVWYLGVMVVRGKGNQERDFCWQPGQVPQ
jgi:hypothetical protein